MITAMASVVANDSKTSLAYRKRVCFRRQAGADGAAWGCDLAPTLPRSLFCVRASFSDSTQGPRSLPLCHFQGR